jgi:hypothetical protein
MKPRSTTFLSAVLLLLLAGCGESPKPVTEKPKEPEKPPAPVTGRWAFHQMFSAARGWALDCQGLRVRSIHLPEVKAEPGKSGAWEATFISPSRNKARTYTYSVIEAPGNLHKGVFAGLEESYSGRPKPFLIAALKTDTDAVYKTALTQGKGAAYANKNPDKNVLFLLEATERFPNPAWRVVWGESVSTSNFSILVDASTGLYLQTLR